MNRESKRNARHEERRTGGKATTTQERPVEGGGRTSPAQFLREVRGELRKVAWPNRQEVGSYTVVVLVTTIVLTLYVFGLDRIIREAVFNLF